MAMYLELVAVFVIVVFVVGAVAGLMFIEAAGINAEENVARKRRSTTLRDEPSSNVTRGIRRLNGVGQRSRELARSSSQPDS